MFGGLLGKRSASTGPIGSPTETGGLPDGVPGPAAAKPREAEPVPVELLFERLNREVERLSVRVKCAESQTESQMVVISQLQSGLEAETAARKASEAREAALSEKFKLLEEGNGQLAGRVADLESKVAARPSSYAAAVGEAASELRAEQDRVKSRTKQLEQQVEQQDRLSRAANVMVFGLEEADGRSPAEQVAACFSSVGAADRNRIVRAVRVGQQRGSDPRPVKVVMAAQADAVAVLRQTRQLRQRKQIRVDRDLTPYQAEQRKSKLGAAQALRDRGYITFFNADQLIFVNKDSGRRQVFDGRMPDRA